MTTTARIGTMDSIRSCVKPQSGPFSSPEATWKTLNTAIRNKALPLFKRCFVPGYFHGFSETILMHNMALNNEPQTLGKRLQSSPGKITYQWFSGDRYISNWTFVYKNGKWLLS